MPLTWPDICKVFFAIFLPPLGVLLERGLGADFCINILLTILGYIPGKIIKEESLHLHAYLNINRFFYRNNSRSVHYRQILKIL